MSKLNLNHSFRTMYDEKPNAFHTYSTYHWRNLGGGAKGAHAPPPPPPPDK